jgi:prepilin-type N-terminal cleavage/methylation domain-containing protein
MKNLRAFSLVELSIVLLIIGILIAGISDGSRLVGVAKLNTARTITNSSPISSIKNLVLWLDSTAEKSFEEIETENNGAISVWYDSNPQTQIRNNLTQSTAERKPSYVSSAINSLPAVRFNNETTSAEDFMLSTLFQNINTYSTVFLVIKTPSSLATTQTIISKVIANDTGTNLQANIGDSAISYCDGIAAQNCYSGATSFSTSTNYVISMVYIPNTSGSGMKFYKNGGTALASTTTDSPDTLLTETLFLGKSGISGAAQYFNGHIGELIIFDRALKDEERISIQNYLSKKWTIKIF